MGKRAENKGQATIETVAMAAGVSTMTVSRALRQPDKVAAPTRARVEQAMQQLGYVHNRLAGALASRHSAQIAVIVPSLQSIVFTEVLAGITHALTDSGYQAVIGITDYDKHREFELLQSMLAWRPAGIILANTHHLQETVHLLKQTEAPVVELMELTRQPIDMSVGLDHRAAGRATAKHLLNAGYRRFAYLGADHTMDLAARSRYRAFEGAVKKGGGEVAAFLTVPELSGISLGRYHIETLLSDAEPFELLYCSNDAVAAGAMMYCMANNIQIPQQLAIASFSGLEIADAMPVPITTIRSPRFDMGKTGAMHVLMRLRGERVATVTNAGFELVPGAST